MILFIKNAIFFLKNNRFKIYLYAGIFAFAFCLGGFYGWKAKGVFCKANDLKIIERKINTRSLQDEIQSMPYDSDSFRNDVLRRGRL
jgi:hypothetical protein